MKKTAFYTYLGTNGTITSTVHLEDIYYVLSYRLEADKDKVLTKDDGKTITKMVTVPADEVDQWKEIYSKVSSK